MITQLIYLTPLARFAEISQLTPLPNYPITPMCLTYLPKQYSIYSLPDVPVTCFRKLPELGEPPPIARSAYIKHLQFTLVTQLRLTNILD